MSQSQVSEVNSCFHHLPKVVCPLEVTETEFIKLLHFINILCAVGGRGEMKGRGERETERVTEAERVRER